MKKLYGLGRYVLAGSLLTGLSAATASAQVFAANYAQQQGHQARNVVTLDAFLHDLKSRFGIYYTYADPGLETRKVATELRSNRIEKILLNTLKPAGLTFRKVHDTYIISEEKSGETPRTKAVPASPELPEKPPGNGPDAFAALALPRSGNEAGTAVAEAVLIKGRVTSAENGEGLPGVSVVLKNTNRGTTTDGNGAYQLTLPEATGSLVFSFVGYEKQEVPLGAGTEVNVSLKADIRALSEVVVVGYGSQKRQDVTGAISSVSAKTIRDIPTPSLDGAMTAQMPGVYVAQTTGTPGGGLTVRVRGTGSIGAGNEPLYVIDGFPITANYSQTSNPLSSINPNDIESIEVLKDASATAIYGSRGANGVVIITTKGGKSGKMRVDVDAYTGIQSVTNYVDVMNAREFAEYIIDSRNNAWVNVGGKATDPNSARNNVIYQIPQALQDPAALGEGTDWQKEIFRQAGTHNTQLTVSGGNDRIRYLTSGGYFRQDGIVLNSDFQRYSFRVNLEADVSKRFKVGLNLTPSYTISNPTSAEGHWSAGGIVLSAQTLAPHLPVYNPDGTYTTGLDLGNGFSSIENPVKLARERVNRQTRFRLLGTAFGEFRITDGLVYKLLAGTDFQTFRQKIFSPSIVGTDGVVPPVIPSGAHNTQESNNWLIEHTLAYTKTIGKHAFNALGGFTAQKVFSENTAITSTNFPNDLVQTLNAGTVVSASTSEEAWTLISYLARANYSYADKYLLTATIRRDGSSRFGSNNKWGVFPSVSAGWRIIEEPFLKNVSFLSDLKLRASYGLTGNNFIGNYDQVGLLGKQNYVFGPNGGTAVNGLGPNRIANPDLSWEKNRQFDLGAEFGLFRNRIGVVVDYYNKITSDLLLSVPTPSVTGYTSARQNIGKVRNRGWEFALSTHNLTGALKWTTDLNLSFNRNVVLALGPSGEPIYGNYQLTSSHITKLGEPMGNFFGYQVEGIYQTQEEVTTGPSFADSRPGQFKFKDVNGDGKLTVDDRTILGNPQPDYTFGLTNSLSYKGFDLSIIVQGVQGNEVLNLGRRFYANFAGTANGLREINQRWRSAQDPGDGRTPQANRDLSRYSSSNASANISSTHLEDGSFVRIRNISLGYNLPDKLMPKLFLRTARVYMNLQNPVTWTKYTGYNPEVSVQGASPLEPGVDYGGYPIARTITVGVNIGL